MLDEQIKAFALAAAPDAQAVALREGALQRIGAVVAVQLFGSAATGLDLPTSDLDLVICGPEASGRPHEVPNGLSVSRGDLVADLREVAKALIAEGVADASRCEVIAAAKDPNPIPNPNPNPNQVAAAADRAAAARSRRGAGRRDLARRDRRRDRASSAARVRLPAADREAPPHLRGKAVIEGQIGWRGAIFCSKPSKALYMYCAVFGSYQLVSGRVSY